MRTILLAAALSLAALAGCSKQTEKAPAAEAAEEAEMAKLPTMTVDEVDHAVAAKEATPVDCNQAATRKRAGVVPGAILVTGSDSYAASELPADKTAKLVFYCANPG
jgi:hypothetical protein